MKTDFEAHLLNRIVPNQIMKSSPIDYDATESMRSPDETHYVFCIRLRRYMGNCSCLERSQSHVL